MAITQTPTGTHDLCMCPHTRLVLSLTVPVARFLRQTPAHCISLNRESLSCSTAPDQSTLLLLPLNIHEVSILVTRSEEPCHVFNLWMTRLNHLLCLEKPERTRDSKRRADSERGRKRREKAYVLHIFSASPARAACYKNTPTHTRARLKTHS